MGRSSMWMEPGTLLCAGNMQMRFGKVMGAKCNCASVPGCIGSDVKSVRREDGVVRMRNSRGTIVSPLIPLHANQPFLRTSNNPHRRGRKPLNAVHNPQP